MNDRAKTLNRRAWALRWRARGRSVAAAETALAVFPGGVARGRALRTLAWHARWLGDFPRAERLVADARDALRGSDRLAQADLCAILGVLRYSQGVHDEAGAIVSEGFDLLDAGSPAETRIDLLVTLATLHSYSCDFAKAYALFGEAVERAEAAGMVAEVARVRHNIARSEIAEERPEAAAKTAAAAVALAAKSRNRVIEPYALEVLGAALVDLKRFGEAEAPLARGLALAEATGDRRAACQILELTGRVCDARRDDEGALAALRRGLAIAEEIDYPLWRRRFNQRLSEVHEHRGDHAAALSAFKAYADIHQHIFRGETERRLADMRSRLEYRQAQAAAVEERRRSAELARARDAAEAAAEAKSQFLATMSHEIRTPMNGVIGMLELMLGGELSQPQRERARVARESARHLLGILNDALDLSKLDAGSVEIEALPLDVRAMLDDIVALLASRAEETGIALRVEAAEALPARVLADPTRLRQVLLNLAGNAVKFTERGEVALTAAWRGDDARGRLRVEVRDTGVGVPEAARGRLFERFSQADSSTTRRFGGTGLGLSICKGLVELMDGEIGVESVEGEGSTFWFDLPLRAAGAEPDEPDDAPDRAGATRTLRILAVEDNHVNRLVLVELLERAGHVVETAENGAEAVAAAARGVWDLVLMDSRMPVMDGAAAARRIRALPVAAGRVPIIALTASAGADERQRLLDAGMSDHLTKPIVVDALHAALERVVVATPSSRRGAA